MGFSQEEGYVPVDIDAIMQDIMTNINSQFGTTYTYEQFVGTSFYKYFYALAQKMQENEVKTSEIFLKLQEYFEITNERISRPVVTSPGIIEKLAEPTDLAEDGYIASVKPMTVEDAGKIHICVDVNDGDHATAEIEITAFANLVSGTDDVIAVAGTNFTAQAGAATPGTGTFQAATSNTATAASLALQINSHATVSQSVRARAAGPFVYLTAIHGGEDGNSITLAYTDNDTNVGATVSDSTLSGGTDNDDYDDIRAEICEIIKDSTVAGCITQGTEEETIVLSNGQSFDFKYNLPARIPVLLRLTTVLSENNQVIIGDPDDVKLALLANIDELYRLGKNFEPQRYFGIVDAPWAESVLLEWSDDGGDTYYSVVFDADYDELFDIALENIELVES